MITKLIVINSMEWLVQNKLVEIYGYVIMPNHIHLLWQQRVNAFLLFFIISFHTKPQRTSPRPSKREGEAEAARIPFRSRKLYRWL